MEWYPAVKKIKTTLYIPVCKDHQDILLNEKSKLQKNVWKKKKAWYLLVCAQNISERRLPKRPVYLLLGGEAGGSEHGVGSAFTFQCIFFDSFWILGHVNVLPIQINKDNSKFKKNLKNIKKNKKNLA